MTALQRHDKVRITLPGRYYNETAHVIRQAGASYDASIVAIREGQRVIYDTIPNTYLQLVRD